MRRALQLIGLIALCAVLYGAGLGGVSLWDIDEASNARAAAEMIESDDWVVPTLNGELRTDKPPLHYWLMAAAYRLLGEGELAARLPAALFGLLTVLLTAWAGGRALGPSAGALAGLMLSVSFLFTVAARSATTDAFLVFFTNLAVLAGFFALRSRGMGIILWAAMGLAVLAKGPVGAVLPLASLVLFCLFDGRGLDGIKRLFPPLGILVFFALAAPWYILAASRTGGDLVEGFLLKHNVGRFLNPMESHRGPFFYYLLVLIPGFFPWSTFLPQAVAAGIRLPKAPRRDQGFGLLLVVWSAVVVLFFTVARTKLPTYILPSFPALALLTAAWAMEVDGHGPRTERGLRWSWAAALLPAAFFPAALLAVFALRIPEIRTMALVAMVFVAAPILGILALAAGRATGVAMRWCAFAAGAAVLAMHLLTLPALEPFRMAPRLGRAAAALARPGDEVARLGYYRPSLVFYGKMPVITLRGDDQVRGFLDRPEGRFVIAAEKDYQGLSSETRGRLDVVERGRDAADSDKVVLLAVRKEEASLPQ